MLGGATSGRGAVMTQVRPGYWERSFARSTGARLFLPQGVDPEIDTRTEFFLNRIANHVGETVVLDATNIAEWIHRSGAREYLNDGMLSPWQFCWVEWTWPETRAEEGDGAAVWIKETLAKDAAFDQVSFLDGVHVILECVGPFWLINGETRGPFGSMQVRLNRDGAIVDERTMTDLGQTRSVWGDPGSDGWQRFFRWFSSIVDVALMSFQFANCRNVNRIEVLPTRQQRRLAERKGEPVLSHYVLAIDANIQRKAHPKGESIPQGKRLHIARGHFATYTEAAPLFGKLVGRFWVPAHVRGRADAGMVSKDYRVEAPSA